MHVNHRHLPSSFKSHRKRCEVTLEEPLCLVLPREKCFLSRAASHILRSQGYPLVEKEVDLLVWMAHDLPALCSQEFTIDRQKLIQFLCEAALTNSPLHEMHVKRQNIKLLYSRVREIIQLEKQLPEKDSSKQLISGTRTRLETCAMQLFVLLQSLSSLQGPLLYAPARAETIFVYDVVLGILNNKELRFTEYILRGFFPDLIDFAVKHEAQERVRVEEIELRNHSIYLEPKIKPAPVDARYVNLNAKWTGIFAAVLLGIFFRWSK